MSKIGLALNDLNELIDTGWDFPDACNRVSVKYHMDYYKLVRAYDEQYAEV